MTVLATLQCSTASNKIYRMEEDDFQTLAFSKSYPVKSRKSVTDAVCLGYATICQVVSPSNAIAEQISHPRKGKNPVYPVNPVGQSLCLLDRMEGIFFTAEAPQ